MSDEYATTSVRIPAELRDAIKAIASDDDRSLSWEIERAIQQYVTRRRAAVERSDK